MGVWPWGFEGPEKCLEEYENGGIPVRDDDWIWSCSNDARLDQGWECQGVYERLTFTSWLDV